MAGINESAITAVVKSAAQGMTFFQDVVQLCNDAGLHLTYTTPLNFPMHQYYRDLKKEKVLATVQKCKSCKKQIKHGKKAEVPEQWTCSGCGEVNSSEEVWQLVSERIDMPSWDRDAKKNKLIKAHMRSYTDDVNTDKSKRAVAPNVIHALDATVLMKTVMLCKEQGISDLMTVHDSFSTTIDNVEVMSWAIRQAFYRTFTDHNPYQELLDQTLARLPEQPDTVPEVPEQGELDLSEVLESKYAFS
jgi:DNA-directed RNA polymerase